MSATSARSGSRPFVLGLAEERQRGFSAELMDGVEAAADELGWRHIRVNDAASEADCDVVLAIGDVRLFPDLVRRPRTATRVLWHGETLPRATPESGGPIHRVAPTGRLLDLVFRIVPGAAGSVALRRRREQAAIVREPLGNLRLLRGAWAAFHHVVIDANDRAEGALRAGLRVAVVPFGYHAVYAGPLRSSSGRPLEAVLLGHLVGREGRRQRLVATLERDLAGHGVTLTRLINGTYGAQRNEILGRTRVVVDIHRLPGNHPGFRFLVAAAAGAVLVTEPLHSPEPLVAGVHYLEAEPKEMSAVVAALLTDEPARLRLVEASQELLATELAMTRILPRVLAGVS